MSAAAAPQPQPTKPANEEIKIVSHSKLFYWWPVWLVSFIMGFWSLADGHMAAVVPTGTEPLQQATIPKWKEKEKEVKPEEPEVRDVLKLPPGAHVPLGDDGKPSPLSLHMAANKNLGVLFVVVLLLVIVITNVPLRGMWSMMIILLIVALSVIFWLGRVWEHIFNFFHFLDIHINAAGYFVIGTVLLIIWLLTFLIFDRYIYVIFTPGQIKVCSEIGGGEQVYDAAGLSLEKQRSDLFRHTLLGLGSGDLIVRTSGAQMHHWEFENVLWIGGKVAKIEEMLKKKAVVATK